MARKTIVKYPVIIVFTILLALVFLFFKFKDSIFALFKKTKSTTLKSGTIKNVSRSKNHESSTI